MSKLFDLIKVMLKIGCIGFGGGSALIPVLEKEVVNTKKMISKEKFDKNVVVASITPGALPVEIAAGVGYLVSSYLGMVLAAISMALPGAIFTILLLTVFNNMESDVLSIVNYIAIPVSVYIIYMLVQYMRKAVNTGKDIKQKISTLGVMLFVFLLNGGKEIDMLIGWDVLLFFDLSSIQILGMAFFIIFFLGENAGKIRKILAGIISFIYVILAGKNDFDYPHFEKLIVVMMFICGIYGLMVSFKSHKNAWNVDWKELFKCIGIWIGFLSIMILPACILYDTSIIFLVKGLLSSIMSFGGGDAYLSVADGLFVQSGMIPELVFYGQLVVVVNILPGSILCKTLSGVGYIIGFLGTGSVCVGIIMAIAGFAVSVFGSCGLSISCFHLYSGLENLTVFNGIKKWIRPIVGGLLISICFSMLTKNLSTGVEIGIGKVWMLLISATIFIIIMMFNEKK